MFASVIARSSTFANVNVVVLGAAGGIGQPLSLLLKNQNNIKNLALYDVVNAPGVAADLSHIPTRPKVTGYAADNLAGALKGADIVVIPAGVPRKPGMTRDDLFNTNASIVAKLVDAVAKNAPDAMIAIISNPVNSTVPIAAEILKRNNVYNPKKLFGVTTLDVIRARTFVGEALKLEDAENLNVPVIGGHAGITILPLFSQVANSGSLSAETIDALTVRTQFGGDEVVKAKAGTGSATLSMAQAAAYFVSDLIGGIQNKNTSTYAFVDTKIAGTNFFATKVSLGPEGVKEASALPSLNAYEKAWFDKLVPELDASIKKGIEFGQNFKLE